jgi:hypothetical protein
MQFLLFKYTPIYNLNLLTKLYDDAAWVKGKPKILIMGSSHARYHIIPKEIAKMNEHYTFADIVNIGENAAGPFEMYTAYMKRKDKFEHVELVYYTLEPHILGEKYFLYTKYEKIFLTYTQWKLLSDQKNIRNEFFFPFQTFVSSLTFHIYDRSKTNGFSALKHKKFNTFSKGKVAKQTFEPLSLFPVSDYQINHLKKLKEAIEKNGGKLIFVLTPTYSWHKYYAEEGRPYDAMLIEKLNRIIGPSVVIGSFHPEDFNLSYEDFKDDTHLARTGAVKFTRSLFQNIDLHLRLPKKPFKHTYLYRFHTNYKQNNNKTK